MVYKYGKRVFDFMLALVALVMLLPVLIGIAIAIRLDTPGPLLFRQKRVGKSKQSFYIYKFRTMRVDTPSDVPTCQLENPDRYISKVGRFLRRTSLDELPQLINILLGEMSFVGPRPVLGNEFELIEQRDMRGVSDLIPGLTGWAQINGRDELSNEDKAKYDAQYLKMRSFSFDFFCIACTFFQVVRGNGVVEGKSEPRVIGAEGRVRFLNPSRRASSRVRRSGFISRFNGNSRPKFGGGEVVAFRPAATAAAANAAVAVAVDTTAAASSSEANNGAELQSTSNASGLSLSKDKDIDRYCG